MHFLLIFVVITFITILTVVMITIMTITAAHNEIRRSSHYMALCSVGHAA